MSFIYSQKKIPKGQWRYGFRSSAATGCGWIATYNALKLMGHYADPKCLIRFYERMIPLLHGNAGTMFFAPGVFFRRNRFLVKMYFRRGKFDQAARNADASILYYHWRNHFKLGAHFVALHHTEQGFVGYNTFSNSSGPDYYGTSLEKFISDRKYYFTVLIAIQNREKQPES